MRIHHLNCGSLRTVEHRGEHRPAVCHCLLLETDRDGLVLVDTGLGTADVADPDRTLGPEFRGRARPALDLAETALHQVRALGHDPRDVRHVLLTHLDLDHAGGLPDFPDAEVHLLEAEQRAALGAPGPHPEDRVRYRPAHWAHRPRWATHRPAAAEPWFGFDAVRPLPDLAEDLALVPLGGHTAGHAAVAVRDRDAGRWLLHCGDAYYFHREMDPDHPAGHPGTDVLQRLTEVDRPLRLGNQARLRELVREHGGQVVPFSAHDPWEYARLAGKQRATTGPVGRLEAAGYVRRVPSPDDRRKVIVEPVGSPAELDRVLAPARQRLGELLGSYPPEQRAVLFDYFARATEAYREAAEQLRDPEE